MKKDADSDHPPERTPPASERLRRADRLGALFTSLPKWTAFAVIVWQARLSIEALAGKNSLASFLVRFGRETSYWELASWAVGILGLLYGLYNLLLLNRQAPKFASRLDAIERRVRMTSGVISSPGEVLGKPEVKN